MYGVDNQNDGVTKDFNAQNGTYRIGGVDVIVPSGGTTGQVLTKSSGTSYDMAWGAGLSSDLPTVTARRTTQQSYTSPTAVSFDTTDIENDTATVEHTNATTFTVKETGLYLIHMNFLMSASNADKTTTILVQKNGTTTIIETEVDIIIADTATVTAVTPARVIELTANDTIQVIVDISGNTGYVEIGSTFGIQRFEGVKGDAGSDGAPGSGSTLIVKDEGTNIANTPHSALNFSGLTVADGGAGVANISAKGIQQVVKTTIGQGSGTAVQSNTATPLVTSGTEIATLNVTPGSTSSQIQLAWSFVGDISTDTGYQVIIFRGSTCIAISAMGSVKRAYMGLASGSFYDAPNTTSEITYSIRVSPEISATVYWGQNKDGDDFNNTLQAGPQQFSATEILL